MSAGGTLERAYRQSLQRHGYHSDPAQEHAVARLEDLRRRLESTSGPRPAWFSRLRRRVRGPDPAVSRSPAQKITLTWFSGTPPNIWQ